MMKKIFLSLAVVLLLLPLTVSALSAPEDINANINRPTNTFNNLEADDFVRMIKNATNWIAGLILIAAVLIILIGAFLYMTSGGDETKTGKARGWIVSGIIGIAIAAISFAIVNLVLSLIKGLAGS
jgi:hypothetical protein